VPYRYVSRESILTFGVKLVPYRYRYVESRIQFRSLDYQCYGRVVQASRCGVHQWIIYNPSAMTTVFSRAKYGCIIPKYNSRTNVAKVSAAITEDQTIVWEI
jgi:hypothetical protein